MTVSRELRVHSLSCSSAPNTPPHHHIPPPPDLGRGVLRPTTNPPPPPDRPSNRQTLVFDCAVLRLSLRQFPTNVQHGAVDPLHLLSQNGPQPSVRRVSLQNKREREVRGEQQRLPTEGFFYPLKRPLARLRPLDRI